MIIAIVSCTVLYLLLRHDDRFNTPWPAVLFFAVLLSIPAGIAVDFIEGPERFEYTAVERLECFSDQYARWYAIAGSERVEITFTPGPARYVRGLHEGSWLSWPLPLSDVERNVELPSLDACR